jgi:hypothetical protein
VGRGDCCCCCCCCCSAAVIAASLKPCCSTCRWHGFFDSATPKLARCTVVGRLHNVMLC